MKQDKRVRIQLDMSVEEAEGLDFIRDKCGLRSRSGAVRTALSVIDWVSREAASGRRIIAMGDGFVSEFVMPGVTINNRQDRTK